MTRFFRRLSRPGSATAVIVVALLVLLPVQIVASLRDTPVSRAALRVPSSPALSPAPSVISETPKPKKKKAKQSPAARASHPSRLSVFAGLGAWVDVYDFAGLDPHVAVAIMKRNYVRTLYIQTGRLDRGEDDVYPEVGPWLVAAHDAGLEIVGWYLPGYRTLSHEVRRTVAIARYRYRGERFDGIGIDIENKDQVRYVPTWNERVAEHAARVRAQLGRSYPIAAITPTPLGMRIAPTRWAGFPWRALASSTDVLMLMNYWSYRTDCPERPEHCPRAYTLGNVTQARALSGKPDMPVHVIGGVGDLISIEELNEFVRAAIQAKTFGASLYDFQTTQELFWLVLSRLSGL
jgi:hypothetical protein